MQSMLLKFGQVKLAKHGSSRWAQHGTVSVTIALPYAVGARVCLSGGTKSISRQKFADGVASAWTVDTIGSDTVGTENRL